MWPLELCCVAIVALYVSVRLARAGDRAAVARRLAILVVAAWLGEDSVIRAYGFYAYSPRWSLFVDQVPLLIVIIWPVVVDSAWQLAARLEARTLALAAAGFVLADAALIEPIAVRAGLWSWSEPGLFAVPPIGILGWALFAACAVALLPRVGVLTVLLAPLGTHALLLGSWWLALRWVNLPLPAWSGVGFVWLIALPVSFYFRSHRLRARVPLADLLVRVPGALFFFVLLGLHGRAVPELFGYAAAFALPYLSLIRGADPSPNKKTVGSTPQFASREPN